MSLGDIAPYHPAAVTTFRCSSCAATQGMDFTDGGETWATMVADVRALGWLLSLVDSRVTEAICPTCVAKGRRLAEEAPGPGEAPGEVAKEAGPYGMISFGIVLRGAEVHPKIMHTSGIDHSLAMLVDLAIRGSQHQRIVDFTEACLAGAGSPAGAFEKAVAIAAALRALPGANRSNYATLGDTPLPREYLFPAHAMVPDVKDPFTPFSFHPAEDVEEFVVLAGACLLAAGIPQVRLVARGYGGKDVSHVLVDVLDGYRRLEIDLTQTDEATVPPPVTREIAIRLAPPPAKTP